MNGGFILDGGSLVTHKQRETRTRIEFGIREALLRSGWTKARSLATWAPPLQPAPPVPLARADCREG